VEEGKPHYLCQMWDFSLRQMQKIRNFLANCSNTYLKLLNGNLDKPQHHDLVDTLFFTICWWFEHIYQLLCLLNVCETFSWYPGIIEAWFSYVRVNVGSKSCQIFISVKFVFKMKKLKLNLVLT
jgi:hypothetical protein